MAISNAFKNQIENRNFLSPIGFKFTLNKAPKTAFFSNSASIPGLTLVNVVQPTYLKNIDLPGDKVEFSDFKLRFLVDEYVENYMEIQNWIRGLGHPESLQQTYNLQDSNPSLNQPIKSQLNLYSDGTLTVLTSNQNPHFYVKFSELYPYYLSDLEFDATDSDVQYFTAEAYFKYTAYDIVDVNGNPL